MPLSLLLQASFRPFSASASKLAKWGEIATLEQEIIGRARSIFLVHWFGRDLPLDGTRVRIFIDNLDALRARFSQVMLAEQARAGRGGATAQEPSLLEPLAGLAGGLGGILFSPGGSVALGLVVARVKHTALWVIGAVVNYLTLGAIPAAVGLLLVVPAAVIGFGMLRPSQLALLAAVTGLLIAARRFWDVLQGPRERMHPLLAAALGIGDALAALVPFLLAAFALIVARIGPQLDDLAVQYVITFELARALWGMTSLTIDNTMSILTEGLGGRRSPMAVVHVVFERLTVFLGRFRKLLDEDREKMTRLWAGAEGAARAGVDAWWAGARPAIRAMTVEHPLVVGMRSFADELGIVADAWKHSARPPSPGPPSLVSRAWSLLTSGSGGSPGPSFPTAPATPPTSSGALSWGLIGDGARLLILTDRLAPGLIPNAMALDTASRDALDAAMRPGGVLAGRLAALRRRGPGGDPTRAAAAAAELAAYHDMAERLVGDAATAYVPRLDDLLHRLHDTIMQSPRRQLPVRALDESRILRADVGRLRVRVVGAEPAAADAWTLALRRSLTALPALVPAGS